MRDVSVAFGGPPILDQANLGLERGERVCLLGRNGAGKSTLMKLLDGTIRPDTGEVIRQVGATVTRLEQEVPGELAGSTFDVVAEGLGESGTLLARYHDAAHRASEPGGEAALREMDRLHHALDAANAWQLETQVETVLSHLGLEADAPFTRLSGGRKRQTLLARALVRQPDVLLLDEPTNHLDVDAIEWMEEFLVDRGATLLFVTHDRAFLRRLATRIVELDRGRLVDWGTDYDSYLDRKEAWLASEQREWAEFDKKLAREEVWIRTGIQARRTRNEGRVRALEQLRVERSQRRERTGTARLEIQEADRSGKLVVEARDASVGFGGRPIVAGLTTRIMRGDRVGLIGPNGSGKTTLLRLLLGQLAPDSGTIRPGTGLEVVYFDQMREQLNPDESIADSVAHGSEWVELGDRRKHVLGYLQDFLFPAERARTPVRALSGGERNRLLLARLFTKSFNVLALDEPTNDLDMETLDLLENLLIEFSGTLLVVSHDRDFLDNVVTSTLVMEGNGRVGEYVGGYADWVRQKPKSPSIQTRPATAAEPFPVPRSPKSPALKRKLSFKETQELAALPDRIERLEQERAEVFAAMSDPVQFKGGGAAALSNRLRALDAELEVAMRRWEELEGLKP
jgi:ATP-binding cassette subfamily F protein uup